MMRPHRATEHRTAALQETLPERPPRFGGAYMTERESRSMRFALGPADACKHGALNASTLASAPGIVPRLSSHLPIL